MHPADPKNAMQKMQNYAKNAKKCTGEEKTAKKQNFVRRKQRNYNAAKLKKCKKCIKMQKNAKSASKNNKYGHGFAVQGVP